MLRFSRLWAWGLALAAAGATWAAGPMFTPTQRSHWAWQRPGKTTPPRVRDAAWVRSPIDAFVLAGLEKNGLKPAPSATPEQLVRRISFDLTGLPPSIEEVDAFLGDRSPAAYERMVDRALASPAFGERWARHWLDLARYADSNGYEFDEIRPDMWRYRDYVVRSFNADKPYFRFVQEQLAGDELAPMDPDALTATGFNLLGPDMTDAASQAARRQNTLNDMTDTAGLAFMGLTVACARCHDHKYEPLTQADYYSLQAFFAPAQFRKDLPAATREEMDRFQREDRVAMQRIRGLEQQRDLLAGPIIRDLRREKIARLPEDVRAAFERAPSERNAEQQLIVERATPQIEPGTREVAMRLPEGSRAEYESLVAQIRQAESRRPPRPGAVGLSESGLPPPVTRILGRGELGNPGEAVTPRVPSILGGSTPPLPESGLPAGSSGRRLALARWIGSPQHPLTARVMANRVWQRLFGRGIVATPSDFGVRGEPPTHPELLDWLGNEFARDGSVKRLIRVIVGSNAYRLSANTSAATLAADPDNQWFSRQNRRRLESEAVRDALLAVSGRLNPRAGGPGVRPPLPEGSNTDPRAWPVTPDAREHTRRSIYLFVRRNLQVPALEVFDGPDTNLSCARRESSTTAPQALALLNDVESHRAAAAMARLVAMEGAGDDARVTALYRRALGRVPRPAELSLARAFLASQSARLRAEGAADPAASALSDLCLAIFNTHAFLSID